MGEMFVSTDEESKKAKLYFSLERVTIKEESMAGQYFESPHSPGSVFGIVVPIPPAYGVGEANHPFGAHVEHPGKELHQKLIILLYFFLAFLFLLLNIFCFFFYFVFCFFL